MISKKVLKTLEYDKIIQLLSKEASSQLAINVIRELLPFIDKREVENGLQETDEAVKLIMFKGAMPIGSFYDIKDDLSLAKKGGILSIHQLLNILLNMKITREIKSFMKGEIPELPMLTAMTDSLEVFSNLEKELDDSIESEDRLSDNASIQLRDIRRHITRQNDDIRNRLNNIINKKDNQTYLQEAIITVRDGRFVVPVKQEYRGYIKGIIHDQSSTGATLFIEPQIIVDMNNKLRELELEEKREEDRIIEEFSRRIGEIGNILLNNLNLMVSLDVIMAKGKMASKYGYEKPTVSDNGILVLKNARHPLIDRKKAVPINLSLGEDYSALIITGPNTGGKTVSLKTVGLLSLMMQSGLHIPANSTSLLPIYKKVFADIGDEQSIEQSLSTFSSHMKNIVHIVDNADEDSLVLLDELGAGTDPTEGAALAIGIIENLKEKGAKIMGTTHYTELKKYAFKQEDVENASMSFDIETLSPTYNLEIGVAGRSNAFEISKKIGLNEKVIEKAQSLLTKEEIAFEEILKSIEDDRRRAEEEREEAIALNIKMKEMTRQAEQSLKNAKEKELEIVNNSKFEARNIIKEANELVKNVQNQLKELSKLESLGERNKRLEKTKGSIKDVAGKYREKFMVEVNDNPVSIDDVKVGDRVKVLSINQNGEILALPDSKGDILVSVGIMKMKCKPKDLKLIIDGKKKVIPKTKAKVKKSNIQGSKRMNISTNINVQGERREEALYKVEKYLDDVYLAGLNEITIIHGRGEGILQKGIHELLKNNSQVKSFRFGNYNEGGNGVTIVEMKQ